MKTHLTLPWQEQAFSTALILALAISAFNASALPKPKFVDENTKYLLKYVSVQDLWVGWIPSPDGATGYHVTTGRILNSGNKTILVADIRMALLNFNGGVIEERVIPDYSRRTVWQPRLEPGQAAAFSALLPPTQGMPPTDWSGEVRVTVVQIQVL